MRGQARAWDRWRFVAGREKVMAIWYVLRAQPKFPAWATNAAKMLTCMMAKCP